MDHSASAYAFVFKLRARTYEVEGYALAPNILTEYRSRSFPCRGGFISTEHGHIDAGVRPSQASPFPRYVE